MLKTQTEPADEMRMKQSQFDDIMRGALGGDESKPQANDDDELQGKRLSAYPPKKKK